MPNGLITLWRRFFAVVDKPRQPTEPETSPVTASPALPDLCFEFKESEEVHKDLALARS